MTERRISATPSTWLEIVSVLSPLDSHCRSRTDYFTVRVSSQSVLRCHILVDEILFKTSSRVGPFLVAVSNPTSLRSEAEKAPYPESAPKFECRWRWQSQIPRRRSHRPRNFIKTAPFAMEFQSMPRPDRIQYCCSIRCPHTTRSNRQTRGRDL